MFPVIAEISAGGPAALADAPKDGKRAATPSRPGTLRAAMALPDGCDQRQGSSRPALELRLKRSLPDDIFLHVCLADVLRQEMHERLMNVLNDAVIVGSHVQVYIRDGRGSAAGETCH